MHLLQLLNIIFQNDALWSIHLLIYLMTTILCWIKYPRNVVFRFLTSFITVFGWIFVIFIIWTMNYLSKSTIKLQYNEVFFFFFYHIDLRSHFISLGFIIINTIFAFLAFVPFF
ncbi:unnamed protein product [Dracunculus medinensis]|uniref:Uncharacterized protein n=1 Tax=Dracunculus medinensis TaxID=318479 RepID=A0A3P7P4A5_DRAME|nr:unnamed protein product [Dracunculus medinensis]